MNPVMNDNYNARPCGINPQSVRRMENRKLLEGEGSHKQRR
jgi:hypothetical protein